MKTSIGIENNTTLFFPIIDFHNHISGKNCFDNSWFHGSFRYGFRSFKYGFRCSFQSDFRSDIWFCFKLCLKSYIKSGLRSDFKWKSRSTIRFIIEVGTICENLLSFESCDINSLKFLKTNFESNHLQWKGTSRKGNFFTGSYLISLYLIFSHRVNSIEWFKWFKSSVRPKTLFWFRSNTETENQIGRYGRPITYRILKPRFKGKNLVSNSMGYFFNCKRDL